MNNDNNDEDDKIDEDIVSGFLLVIVTVSDSMMRLSFHSVPSPKK
jgi:hypothetical protein